jgi:hypothetical protein
MATPTTPAAVRLEAGSSTKINTEGKEVEIQVAARYEVQPTSEAVQALIDSGKILKNENVLVKVGDEYVVYTQLTALTAEAAAALLDGVVDMVLDERGEPKQGAPSVLSNFVYGYDLNAKRAVRQLHEKKVKGPEKTVNSTIKGLMALGYSQAEAEALAKAKLPTA